MTAILFTPPFSKGGVVFSILLGYTKPYYEKSHQRKNYCRQHLGTNQKTSSQTQKERHYSKTRCCPRRKRQTFRNLRPQKTTNGRKNRYFFCVTQIPRYHFTKKTYYREELNVLDDDDDEYNNADFREEHLYDDQMNFIVDTKVKMMSYIRNEYLNFFEYFDFTEWHKLLFQ